MNKPTKNKLTKNERKYFNWFLDNIEQDLGMGLDCNFVEEHEDDKFPKQWIRKDGGIDVDKLFKDLRQKVMGK